MLDLETLAKYQRLFGIKTSIVEFCPKELKRRWRILVQKYHPDHGGQKEHFEFVQEAYAYLKKKCKGQKQQQETDGSFSTEMPFGIREIKVPSDRGGHVYLWDIGEPDFRKRAEHFKRTGSNSVHVRKSYGYV